MSPSAAGVVVVDEDAQPTEQAEAPSPQDETSTEPINSPAHSPSSPYTRPPVAIRRTGYRAAIDISGTNRTITFMGQASAAAAPRTPVTADGVDIDDEDVLGLGADELVTPAGPSGELPWFENPVNPALVPPVISATQYCVGQPVLIFSRSENEWKRGSVKSILAAGDPQPTDLPTGYEKLRVPVGSMHVQFGVQNELSKWLWPRHFGILVKPASPL